MKSADILKSLAPVRPQGVFDKDLDVEGELLDSARASAVGLLLELFPDTCSTTITDWERDYGITPLSGQSLEDRRRAVCRKARWRAGLSKSFFIAVAALYGQNITIEERRPARCGAIRCAFRLYSPDVKHIWTVHGLKPPRNVSRCGTFTCGSRLGGVGTGIEALFRQLKPSHTLVTFVYDGE
ncbi:MAG: DUF2313 domain-containing protein [Elusimicrobia bacterium]|nr:DUF2313 domain-containing protein [Elusimicrobiota bacterium]